MILQNGLSSKNPPKLRFKKIVKLSGHTCYCKDLTNFEYQVRAMTKNGIIRNFSDEIP